MSGRKKSPEIMRVIEQQPSEGGSYTRDPVTGELTRVEHPALDPTDPLHEANVSPDVIAPVDREPEQPAAGDTAPPPVGEDNSQQEG